MLEDQVSRRACGFKTCKLVDLICLHVTERPTIWSQNQCSVHFEMHTSRQVILFDLYGSLLIEAESSFIIFIWCLLDIISVPFYLSSISSKIN
jgi:hypothetical protein